jgi:hypothetical protein
MDAFTWFKIINRTEFLATGLVSRELSIVFQGIGAKTVLITVGNFFSITIDDVMLSLGITDASPFIFGERAIFADLNDDVWYGVPK